MEYLVRLASSGRARFCFISWVGWGLGMLSNTLVFGGPTPLSQLVAGKSDEIRKFMDKLLSSESFRFNQAFIAQNRTVP